MKFFNYAFIFYMFGMHAESVDSKWENLKDDVINQAKTVYDGGVGFLKGMGQGFGYVTPEYKYSFEVWNDAPAPIVTAVQRLTGILGASFTGNIVKGLTIGPYTRSGEAFYNMQLYISVWLCADKAQEAVQKYSKTVQDNAKWGSIIGAVAGLGVASPLTTPLGAGLGALVGGAVAAEQLEDYKLLKKDIYPWAPHDKNIYYYRTYTDKKVVKGEYLGIKKSTDAFLGQFYNSSKQSVTFNFKKDNQNYSATLEPASFNMLESNPSVANSIRPAGNEQRGFEFLKGTNAIAYIPLMPEGIANVSYNEAKKNYEVIGPMLMTYEIYQDAKELGVSMQGLSIGSFDQPVSGKIRDINPLLLFFWYQDGKENQSLSQVPFIASNQQVWLSYSTKDSVVQEKLNPGTVISKTALRPLISEGKASLFVVALQTTDDAKAKAFLKRLHQGKFDHLLHTPDTKLSMNELLSTLQPTTKGFIDDTQGKENSGVIGAILLSDTFFPAGIGSGPYYYSVEPPLLPLDQFSNLIYFDDQYYQKNADGDLVLADEVRREIAEKIPLWINRYPSEIDAVKREVLAFMQNRGNKGLFTNPAASPAQRILNPQGNQLLESFLNGPLSLKNYPLIMKAGTNYYPLNFGEKPETWPS